MGLMNSVGRAFGGNGAGQGNQALQRANNASMLASHLSGLGQQPPQQQQQVAPEQAVQRQPMQQMQALNNPNPALHQQMALQGLGQPGLGQSAFQPQQSSFQPVMPHPAVQAAMQQQQQNPYGQQPQGAAIGRTPQQAGNVGRSLQMY
jgi:hypothetical protein